MTNNLIFTVNVILLLALLSACGADKETKQEEKKVPVQTVVVQSKRIALPITTGGKLSTSTESKLSFKIPGIVDKIFVQEGQTVAKNTVLASLDLVEMQARVQQARSGFQKAERDLERIRRLYADSVVTLEQMQNTKTALDIAKSDLEVAEFNLRYSKIIAPVNGKILKKFAEEGELIAAGNPLFLFGEAQEGWVMRVSVTDRQLISLDLGDRAEVQFDAFPDKIFPGIVSEIQAIANPYTGTFEVEIKLADTDAKLYSGFVGRVKLIPGVKKPYYVIPLEALVEGDGRDGYIYLVNRENLRVSRQPIQITAVYDGQLLVRSGVQEGQHIVTSGAAYLSQDALIDINE